MISNNASQVAIAVDVGGTFTDVVAVDAVTGAVSAVKVPSRPGDVVGAVRDGALSVLDAAGAGPAAVDRFVHGTTVGTNAVLERKGAVTAMLSTEGFEDVLEIGRLRRTVMYDLFMDAETPVFLAPRRRRRGIRERIGADGSIVRELDEAAALTAIRELIEDHGVESFAVCLLFSFRNPVHEIRVRELIHQIDPEASVSLSSEVDPMFREYERSVVTGFDAYLRPVIARYVTELGAELQASGISASLQIIQSRGGITGAAQIADRPVSVLLSGPAAGVVGGMEAGAGAGYSDVITIDVGGTSADIALVAEGKPLISTTGEFESFPLRVPMVDLNTIGAGGGSIAWVDAGGSFRVGPQSAGADPGPVCYGRGGMQPTVTDASVVLGYLNPDYFAGGTLKLDVAGAHDAIERLAEQVGLSPVEAAAGIHTIVNAKMANEIRLVSVQRGYDPRAFALVLLGGAGPVHGGRLAAELGIPSLVVPPLPGVLSALGLLQASVEHDIAETVAVQAAEAQTDELEATYASLERRVLERMVADRAPEDEVVTARSADMRYVGQSYTLAVDVSGAVLDGALAKVVSDFHAVHERIYGHSNPEAEVELVNLRVTQSWPLPAILDGQRATGAPAVATTRSAYFQELAGYVETPVVRRSALAPGQPLEGPAIIEQDDTTLVLYPRHRATLHESGNIVVTVPGDGPSHQEEAEAVHSA